MTDTGTSNDTQERDAIWPFVALYAFMWAGMIGLSLNTDAIRFDYSMAAVLGLACAFGIVIYLAAGRLRRRTMFEFERSTTLGNLAWHVFLLTAIVFFCFLSWVAVVQIMVLTFHAPVFESECDKISQRDVALFVWEAMAKGVFKFLAGYLPLPAEACAPNPAGWTATITAQCVRWFTALVVVWYAVGFVKAWYIRARQPKPVH